jgi:hypothetical protein
MANGRNNKIKNDSSPDAGGFVALPWCVLDCPAYSKLSHPARSLLIEFARQFVRDNNGRLLASSSYLRKRGWNSPDVITRAKRELLKEGFIFETVMGHRPNKASWYAVTWRSLDNLKGYDTGAKEMFHRGAYALSVTLKTKPTREQLYQKWRETSSEYAQLTSSDGAVRHLTAPSDAVAKSPIGTPAVPIVCDIESSSRPSHVHHLEKPSLSGVSTAAVLTATAPKSNTKENHDGL